MISGLTKVLRNNIITNVPEGMRQRMSEVPIFPSFRGVAQFGYPIQGSKNSFSCLMRV